MNHFKERLGSSTINTVHVSLELQGGIYPRQVTGPSQDAHTHLILTHRWSSDTVCNLMCIFLDCGRKPEHLEKTHADHQLRAFNSLNLDLKLFIAATQ